MDIIKKGNVDSVKKLKIEKVLQWRRECTCENCNTVMSVSIFDFDDFYYEDGCVDWYSVSCPVCGKKYTFSTTLPAVDLPFNGAGMEYIRDIVTKKETYQINSQKKLGIYRNKRKFFR